nr:TMEM165/GDT1 family protein [Candidatus Sigynarchaeota archaeon]
MKGIVHDLDHTMIMSFFTAFFVAFGLIFIAELGDKTQLVILTLATRGYNVKLLAAGACSGFAIIVFLGGIIAVVLSAFFDLAWIAIASGIAFVIIGLVQLYQLWKARTSGGGETGEEKEPEVKARNSFLVGIIAIISMELGDKTQLMTIMLAATSGSLFGTLI